jgi:prepilin-type N-terminal cleavage/methylation domain-containing protein
MNRRGFTLIELLVVILIIAILAAFLYPVITHAQENAVQTDCMAKLVQVAKSVKQYQMDHRAYPPSPLNAGAYVATAGLVGVMADHLPMACKDDSRPEADFVGGQFSYAYDDVQRAGAGVVPADIEDRLLYNYRGYTAEGYEISETDANDYLTLYASAAAPPAGITDWTKFPMLANRNAPPNTIITHCPFHRMVGTEMIVRLDGSAKGYPDFMYDADADVTRWEQDGTGWIAQPL